MIPLYSIQGGYFQGVSSASQPICTHISEEMFEILDGSSSICLAHYPKYNAEYLVESEIEYPISINGKMRFTPNWF